MELDRLTVIDVTARRVTNTVFIRNKGLVFKKKTYGSTWEEGLLAMAVLSSSVE